jgi:hypothetical protein
MKYVNTFESFKTKRLQPLNEELLGAVINFFKNMWAKATAELKKLGDNPSLQQLDQWIEKNPFNPADDTYVLKSVMEEFNKKPAATDQDCLTLIDSILDPETGALGKQGMQSFYDQIIKAFGNNTGPLNIIQYYMERIRDRAIKDYKFAGGPDLKVGQPVKLDPKKKTIGLDDATHLPDFKKILKAATDDKKKKEATINWVNKTLVPRLEKYATEVTDEEVEAYLKTKGVEMSGDYKVGDTVIYKREKFNQANWDALTDDDKKKPNEGKIDDLETKEEIGTKKISKIEGEKVSFEGADFTKLTSDILMKIENNPVEGQEDLTNTLKDLKTKNADAIQKIDDISKLYMDPVTNKEKIEEIEKAIGGGA